MDSFTEAVFEAEGLDPRFNKRLQRQVREVIDQHMRRWSRMVCADGTDE